MKKVYKIKKHKNIYSSRKNNKNLKKVFLWIFMFFLLFAVGFFGASSLIGLLTKDLKNPAPDTSSGDLSAASSLPDSSSSLPEAPKTRGIRFMPADIMADPEKTDEFIADAKLSGFDTVAVPAKLSGGQLTYSSAVPTAKDASGTAEIAEIADKIRQAGMKPAATVSAFKDSLAPVTNRDAAVKYKPDLRYIWYDGNRSDPAAKPWLNPASAEATGYISDIIAELTSFGFAEIILSDVQFPIGQGMNLAWYTSNDAALDRQKVLSDFISGLRGQYPAAEFSLQLPLLEALEDKDNAILYGVNPILLPCDKIYADLTFDGISDIKTDDEPRPIGNTAADVLDVWQMLNQKSGKTVIPIVSLDDSEWNALTAKENPGEIARK